MPTPTGQTPSTDSAPAAPGPQHPPAAAQGDRRSLYKAFAASLSGTSLEWYDFAVYSSAAARGHVSESLAVASRCPVR